MELANILFLLLMMTIRYTRGCPCAEGFGARYCRPTVSHLLLLVLYGRGLDWLDWVESRDTRESVTRGKGGRNHSPFGSWSRTPSAVDRLTVRLPTSNPLPLSPFVGASDAIHVHSRDAPTQRPRGECPGRPPQCPGSKGPELSPLSAAVMG